MGENTSIGWTDHTFNPWWGCMKVGPGCDFCYADAFDRRIGGDHWGAGKPRRYFKDSYWNGPLKWNREADRAGMHSLVFCASMADVFDNEIEQEHRERLWRLIRDTPMLTWLLVTKRIGNAPTMLPDDWGDAGYLNVWLLSTVCNQEEADRDIPKLASVPARIHGLSVEPQLEPIDLTGFAFDSSWWVICGGESGPKARPFMLDWARSLRDQCAATGTAFFFKQTGSHPDGRRVKGKGDDPAQWPDGIGVRQFPAMQSAPRRQPCTRT